MQFQPPSQPGWGQPEPDPLDSRVQQLFYPPQQPAPYPPQQWRQPPMMPMQPQKPPKKKTGRILGIGCGALIALVVLIAIIAAAGNHGSTTATPGGSLNIQSIDQSTPTSQPTTANKIGVPITSGNWVVTVNSVKTTKDPGNQFITLDPGNVFLVVNATLKNLDSSPQTASTLAQWSLRDASGTTYNEELGFGSSAIGPEGDVAPGQLASGQFAYQVPTTAHQFTLQFEGDLASADLAQWSVNI